MRFKNISIRQISILITLLVSAVNILFVWLTFSIWGLQYIFFVFPIILIFNFTIVRFFLVKYVFSRIKLIYKLIYESKKDKSLSTNEIHKESLEDVNTKVMEWAENTKNEIASLKSLEAYRKNYLGNISHELKTPIFSIQAYLLLAALLTKVGAVISL